MKILWFCNTPANATFFLNMENIKGGWMQTLDVAIQNKVDLHVAFISTRKIANFKHLNTHYYPIYLPLWKIRVLQKLLFNRSLFRKADCNQYLDLVNIIKPDLIHIFGTENSFVEIINKTKTPILVSVQGILNSIYTKYFGGFSDFDLIFSKTQNKSLFQIFFSNSYFKRRRKFKNEVNKEKHVLRSVKYIDGRTSWDKRVLSILAKDAKYFHIDRILRKSFYFANWQQPKNNDFIIHTTTNGNLFKGFDILSMAIAEVSKIIPNLTIRIAGINYDDPVVKLTKKKMGKNFPFESIVFLGRVSDDKILASMLSSNLYISTSFIENSPNNLAEALLIGMPCVSSFAGGTSTYIENGVNGFLFQEGDYLDCAGLILLLWRDPELANRIGKTASEIAKIRHNEETIVSETIKTYKHIINDSY